MRGPGHHPRRQPALTAPHPLVALRVAGVEDVDLLLDVHRCSATAGFTHIFDPDDHPFPSDAARDAWGRAVVDPDVTIVVAERDGCPVGLVAFGAGELKMLYVVPAAWGTGVGLRLHDHAVAALADEGSATAQLWVLEENVRARRFYERLGWRPDARRRTAHHPPHPPVMGYSLEGLPARGR